MHEQSRSDWDFCVSVLMENVKPGAQQNFKKASNDTHSGRGTPFYYDSIMIYGTDPLTLVLRESEGDHPDYPDHPDNSNQPENPDTPGHFV